MQSLLYQFSLPNITTAELKIFLFLQSSIWRDGRVVECGGLENHCTAMYRGFESLSLRKTQTKMFGFFYFIDVMKAY